MNQYPKCQNCKHSKSNHGAVYLNGLCEGCYNFALHGPHFEFEWELDMEHPKYCKTYIPDNLSFIEKLAERRGLV